MLCRKCGSYWNETSTTTSYYFSSTSYPKGSYTSPLAINAAAEEILTCPMDSAMVSEPYGRGTPSGGNMMEGDDRATVGDETDPDRDLV